jgi:hypothetical protein
MMHPMAKSDPLKDKPSFYPCLPSWSTSVEKRQPDILKRTQTRKQIKVLENESDSLVPKLSNLNARERKDIFTIEQVLTMGWTLEAAEN